VKLTQEEYDELIRQHPNLAPLGTPGLHPPKPEPAAGCPLDHPVPGEKEGRPRFAICIEVHAARPCDWDNYRAKELQDLLCHSGILHDDAWDVLEGSVSSKKVRAKADQKTIITLKKL
jgi:hypothetical protein